MSSIISKNDYKKAWELVDKIFKNKPLPSGSNYKIEEVSGTCYVVIEKPYKQNEKKY